MINLDINDGKMVFEALAELPFKYVYELIGKLNRQANQSVGSADVAEAFNGHSLSIQEIALMINALGQMPFNRVHRLLNNLNGQIRMQND